MCHPLFGIRPSILQRELVGKRRPKMLHGRRNHLSLSRGVRRGTRPRRRHRRGDAVPRSPRDGRLAVLVARPAGASGDHPDRRRRARRLRRRPEKRPRVVVPLWSVSGPAVPTLTPHSSCLILSDRYHLRRRCRKYCDRPLYIQACRITSRWGPEHSLYHRPIRGPTASVTTLPKRER